MSQNNYINRARADVKNFKPGYQNKAWFAPRSWFEQVAEPAANAVGPLINTVVTDHLFTPGTGFVECYLAPRKNTVTAETKGDFGLLYLEWGVEIVFPGDDVTIQTMMEAAMNEDLILIQRDVSCPTPVYYQFGCDCMSSNPESVKFDGSKVGETAGKAWTLSAKANCRYEYKGTIAVMP